MNNLNKTPEMIEKLVSRRVKKGERDIVKRYALLLNELRKELAKLYEKYEVNGKLTYAEMAKYDRLRKFIEYIDYLLKTVYKDVRKTIYDVLGESYLDGYYLTAWAVETDTLSRLSYSAVRPEVITAAIENPITGLTLSRRLEKNRAAIIYTIQQEITQGLVQGESYRQMATRIKGVLENDVVKANRIVRTEAHRAVETGKLQAAEHAHRNGVIMVKEWNTMHDQRVRDRHKHLDGTKIPVDEDFKIGTDRAKAPGLFLRPENSINCRCFLTYSVERVEKVDAKELDGMTFEQWKKERLRS
ncbi:NAD(+)--arginine ADP-ribosyltransferase EFV [Parageobacillus caldoxylosilyticus]|uniref:phage minor head protein n=1 Tax=Saccharococcus caldoxylosilyticus TaxID=81408 RepID=UPI001C4E23D4|nr:phage minor head protein [Parageobacillus caldoxylosilyticus]QXJ39582.1 NAD(+)--arginine ADP-ribosyltransferase EFV [Parageobacillus caldoxylosilyticus]